MNDIRQSKEYAAVAEHLERLHAPAFGRPYSIFDPQVTGDASRLLVTGAVLDALEGIPRTELFVVRDGELVSAVGHEGSSRAGRFSPGGETLAYASDRVKAGQFQLWLAGAGSSDGGTAAAEVDGSIEYLSWSPDGRQVLLGVAGLGADMAGAQGSGANQDVENGLPSWHPEVEDGTPEFAWRSLWVHDVATGELSRVSPEGVNCWEASWSGSDQVLAITSDSPSEDSWYTATLSLIDPATQVRRELLTSDVQLALPAGSPDGRFAAVVQAVCSDRGIVAGDLLVVDLTTDEQVTVPAGADVSSVQWISAEVLGFAALRGLDTIIGRYDTSTGQVEELYSSALSSGIRYPEATFTAAGEIVVVQDSYNLPHRVAVVRGDDTEVLASIGNPGSDYLLSIAGTAEAVSWEAPDGLRIEGVLCVPEGDGPFPLVVNIHGGPVWAFRNVWSMYYQWVPLLVSRGYAVLSPNPRGSGGRGQDFASQVVGDMGGKDTYDYISGVDALVERGIVDPARVGLIGGSYGGFMSSWLVTQDQRFAAAVPISPVTDWYSQSFTSNIAEWGKGFLNADPEIPGTQVHTRSPVLQASKVRTPTLNIAGANDRCTPPAQAREFHQALTANGVESALVIYPEEGHGVRSYPAMADFLTRIVTWFERHMPA